LASLKNPRAAAFLHIASGVAFAAAGAIGKQPALHGVAVAMFVIGVARLCKRGAG
jgi:hypothetical protein